MISHLAPLPSGSRIERALAWLLLVACAVYLSTFVDRGWIPHDEGTLGQGARYVLAGYLPHVAYNEPYTGGLAFIYAAAFRIGGFDLIAIRWTLFVAAIATLAGVHILARRFFRELGAATVAAIGLLWSFPNYFAGLPSWWLLACAVWTLWGLFRYLETGSLWFVVVAALAAGTGVTIKQTGVFVVAALILTMLSIGVRVRGAGDGVAAPRWLRVVAAAVLFAGFTLLIGPKLRVPEALYLLLPLAAAIGATCMAPEPEPGHMRALWPAVLAGVCALIPLGMLALAYVPAGAIEQFFQGAFLAPFSRFEYSARPFPPVALWMMGLALPVLFLPTASHVRAGTRHPVFHARLALALALLVGSVWSVFVYQLIFQGVRTIAMLLPLAAALPGLTPAPSREHRLRYLAMSMVLATASMVQFPFYFGIYFAYVTPLVVLVGAALLANRGVSLVPFAVLLAGFGLLANRGYVETFGARYTVERLGAPLDLPGASLRVSDEERDIYRRLTRLVETHLGSGTLIATPDCPEVYFLTGKMDPLGHTFEFLDSRVPRATSDTWADATVVVVNHGARFSKRIDAADLESLRRSHPYSARVGGFEVHWRTE